MDIEPPGDPAPIDAPGDPATENGSSSDSTTGRASDALKADLARERKTRQAAEKELEKLRQADRLRVASQLGLPVDVADRLRGDTFDELLEDGKTLQKLLKTADEKEKKRPPSDGGKGGGEQPKQDVNSLLRAAVRGN